MNDDRDWDRQTIEADLLQIRTLVDKVAQHYQGNSEGLLVLLRALESLHREIREEMFEPSLPNIRKDLSHLLKNIEETGGWPYIERMKLQTLLYHLALDPISESISEQREK